MGRSLSGRPQGPPHGPFQGPPHGLFGGPFDNGASGAPPDMMAHPHRGSPSPGDGGGMKQRGGRHGGRMGGRRGRGNGGGGGGGDMQQWWKTHLVHFDDRHQPQVEAY
ncbi:unnamed protein product [Laminaria digitata]